MTDSKSRDHASTKTLQALIDVAPIAIGVTDDQGSLLAANRRMVELSGYPREEIFEVGMGGLCEDPGMHDALIEEARERGKVTDREVTVVGKHGAIVELSVNLQRVPWEGRAAWLWSLQDLGGARQAERALRDSERRHRMISELMSDFAYSFTVADDGSLHMDWITDAIERITGYSAGELESLGGWDGVVYPEDADVPQQQLERLLAGEVAVVEYRIVTRSRQTRWVRDHGRPEWDPLSGRVGRIYGAVRDITEQRAMGQRLAHAAKMEAVSSLVGGLVLDFNNLLTGILGQASMLERESRPGERAYKAARVIRRAARRAGELTDQLLSYTHGERTEQVSLDVHQLIRDGLALVGRTAGAHVRFNQEQITTEATVMGDPAQLQQVVINLLLNAADALPDGGDVTVVTRVVEVVKGGEVHRGGIDPGRYLELEITDSGVGIAEEIRGRIFEPYFTTKILEQGAGMGLASAYGIVRNHGGSILVESEEGEGTTFRVMLPLAVSVIAAAERRERALDATSGSGQILVVDDEPVILDTLAEMLASLGYEVVVAPDGSAALEVFSRIHDRLDLVILDLSMPVLDGRDCYMAMREIDPHVPTLIATGLGTDETDLLEAGVHGIVRKPFSVAQLGDTVADALASS